MSSNRVLLRSFSAGELTPELFGRVDFDKFNAGLALCRNFYTLPHGPAVNRPGTQFVLETKNSSVVSRLIPFNYNNQQVFAIELGAGYFRFHTNGAVLGYPTPAAWSSVTSYSAGDMIASSGVNYIAILGSLNITAPNTTYWYPVTTSSFEIPNSYAAADITNINYVQSSDVVTFVHPGYPPAELRRLDAAKWSFQPILFASTVSPPAGNSATAVLITHQYVVTDLRSYRARTAHKSGSRTTYTYTNVSIEGTPSLPVSVSADLTLPGTKNTLTWVPDPGTIGHVVYKYVSGLYYYIGTASGASFVDDGRQLPTTRVPPTGGVAFASTALGVTTASANAPSAAVATGAGAVVYSYVVTAVDSVSGGESISTNAATCSNDLTIAGHFNTMSFTTVAGVSRYNVYKLSNGLYGYIGTSGSNQFVDNNITADISHTPPMVDQVLSAPGDYPSAVAYFEQRRVFGGTTNSPQSMWMTRSGTESDMGYTIPVKDDNRLAFRIAAREASAIQHIVPIAEIIVFTASAEWRIGSVNSGAITPTTLSAKPQAYNGSNNATPIVVNNVVLYASSRGGHIRELSYQWQGNSYTSADISLLAPHLFDYYSITDMAYSKGPIPMLWCVSSNGQLLSMTYVKEQNVIAWHHHDTGNGDIFEAVCTINENNEDMLYCIVRRTINGATKRYVERLHTRKFLTLADAFFVDCGVTYYNAGTFTRAGTVMTIVMTVHGLSNAQTYSFAFSDTSFGAVPAGVAYVVTVIDVNTFTIAVANAGATTGTITQQVTTLNGLTWLEGCTVNILVDGGVSPQQAVTGGAIILPVPGAKITVGIPIQADLQTLPVAMQTDTAMGQGRPKNVNRAWMRVTRSSGFMLGPTFDAGKLIPYKQRRTEAYGTPPSLITGEINLEPANAWSDGGQICIRQNDPLPIDIASITLDVSMGG